MASAISTNELKQLFPGKSQLAELMQSLDWSHTDLPPPNEWPEELRISVKLCLTARIPIVIFWGPNFTMLYNDSYIPFLGHSKHPHCLGKPGKEAWSESWEIIEPIFQGVYASAEPAWSEDIRMFFTRTLPLEEVYIRFTNGPILDADGKTVLGIFCPSTETTEQVINARRLETLRHLGKLNSIHNVSEACKQLSKIMSENPSDIPFSAIYAFDEIETQLSLQSYTGLKNISLLPDTISSSDSTLLHALLASAFYNQQAEIMTDVVTKELYFPGGPWSDLCDQLIILPIPSVIQESASAGVLLLGISSRAVFDHSYRSFFDLLVRQIGSVIANAKTYRIEHKRAESLAELNRAKSRFFSNISYEFKTPLTLLLGPIENALNASEKNPIVSSDNLRMIYRNALKLLNLVNTLLDFSKIESELELAHFEPIDIAMFTYNVASHFRLAMEKAGLKFNIYCDRFAEDVYVDKEMWEKIIFNLLSNAFKFTAKGEIELRLLSTEENTIQLLVRDTGIGIATEELSRLFERFHRIEGAKGRTYEGLGIGLALVQDLVKIHGGTITVESKIGQGTTFIVSLTKGFKHLPSNQVVMQPTKTPYSFKSKLFITEVMRWLPDDSKTSYSKTSTDRILIVDGNADMREYLFHLLSEQWIVETVSDGQAALEKVQNSTLPIDLILTDVMMPRLDGFQLLKAIKTNLNSYPIPIIMISAQNEKEGIKELETLVDDYLIKPFSAKELIARIKIQLKLSKKRKALMKDLTTMTRLHFIATRFVQEADVSMLLLEILDAAMDITNADKANIQLLDEDEDVLKIVASRGFDQSFLDYFAVCPAGKGTCGVAFKNERRVIVEDVMTSPIFINTPHLAPLLAEGIRAIQSTPLKSSSGKIVGVLSTHYRTQQTIDPRDLQMMDLLARLTADIIERGHWIKERAKLLEKLRKADKRKNNFLAVLSHELRNPLASISNSIFTLSRSIAGTDSAFRAQTSIERQVKQMTRLVDDLLDVTRITRNKISLQLQKIDVNDLVYQTVEDHRLSFEFANISLHVSLSDAPLIINADSARVAQVIGNLLHNAVKFTKDKGETSIIVKKEEESNHAVIYVIDNGIGIESSLLENIFEPFTQADSFDLSKGGLGLGLALVKGLVEQHDGTVKINSKGIGHGTEVIVKLPLDKSTNNEVLINNSQKNNSISQIRALLIEDNIDVAESLRDVLEIYKYEVYVAHNGQDGIQKALEFKPDFVLCDIGLPNMNGFEVAKVFKKHPALRSIFLIGLSGYAQLEYKEKAYLAGFDHYLAKPLDLNILLDLLNSNFGKLKDLKDIA